MNLTTNNTKPVIIGIDHGYGNIKTAHAVFKTGVTAYDKEPTFKSNMLGDGVLEIAAALFVGLDLFQNLAVAFLPLFIINGFFHDR